MANENALAPGWSVAASDIFTRPLDTLEIFYKGIGDTGAPLNRDTWATTLQLKLKLPDSVKEPASHLGRAWVELRRRHPHLGAIGPRPSAPGSARPQQFAVGPLDPEEWLRRSFVVHEGTGAAYKDADEAVRITELSVTATAHWFPATSEFLLRSSHWRIDGLGLVMLAHSFMSLLASSMRLDQGPSDIVDGPLTPSITDVLGLETSEGSTPEHVKNAADALIMEYMKGVPSVSLPVCEGAEQAMPGKTSRISIKFDEHVSKAMKVACEDRGISVGAAVQTSIIRATASYPQSFPAKGFAGTFPINLRKFLPHPYDGAEYAASLAMCGIPLAFPDVVDNPGTFDEMAQKVGAVFAADLSRLTTDQKGEPVSFASVAGAFLRRTMMHYSNPPPGLPPIRTPEFSSLGLLEKYSKWEYEFGSDGDEVIQVEDASIGIEVLGQAPVFHVFTFRDTTRIQVCFNESYYEEKLISEALEKVKAELLQGLQIGV